MTGFLAFRSRHDHRVYMLVPAAAAPSVDDSMEFLGEVQADSFEPALGDCIAEQIERQQFARITKDEFYFSSRGGGPGVNGSDA